MGWGSSPHEKSACNHPPKLPADTGEPIIKIAPNPSLDPLRYTTIKVLSNTVGDAGDGVAVDSTLGAPLTRTPLWTLDRRLREVTLELGTDSLKKHPLPSPKSPATIR
jgi:hypothetical protein